MNKSIKTNVPLENKKVIKTKNSIYFIGGEKGGVGKSFFARCLIDYFVFKGWQDKFLLTEGDPTINDVGCIFKDNSQEARFSDDERAWHEPNIIIDRIKEKTAVVNLPSNVMDRFNSWMDRLEILHLKEKYCQEIGYFFVSDGCWRSMQLFMRQLKLYDTNKFPHVLVLNGGRVTGSKSFEYLEKICPGSIKLLKNKEVPLLYIPKLDARVQFVCDRTNLSYTDLKNLSEQEEELKKRFEEVIGKDEFSELLNFDEREKLLDNMITRVTNISGQQMFYYFVKKNQELFDQIFKDDINCPSGLKDIYETQKKELDVDILPK